MNKLKRFVVPLIFLIFLLFIYFFDTDFLSLLDMPISVINTVDKFILSFIWLFIGLIAISIFNLIFWEQFVTKAIGTPPPKLLVQLTSFLLFLVVVSFILHLIFEFKVSVVWTASGIFSLVVAFALRNLIIDTFSGLFIHMEQPFKVGDWITCSTRFGNFMGEVLETNWRTTRLLNSKNATHIIPNSMITSTALTNYSMPEQYAEFEDFVTLDFSVSTERAMPVLEAALSECLELGYIHLTPRVRVEKIVADGVLYNLTYALDMTEGSPNKGRNRVLKRVLKHLSYSGLTPSYPKIDQYQTNMPWRQKSWEDDRDLIKLIAKISIFSSLSEADLSVLSNGIITERFHAGQDIVRQGTQTASMYILTEGLLEIFILQENEQIKVANLAPGAFFGEKSLLTGEPRSATVRAKTDVLVAKIEKETIKELLDRNPKVVSLLSNELADRELQNNHAIKECQETHKKQKENEANLFMDKIINFFKL